MFVLPSHRCEYSEVEVRKECDHWTVTKCCTRMTQYPIPSEIPVLPPKRITGINGWHGYLGLQKVLWCGRYQIVGGVKIPEWMGTDKGGARTILAPIEVKVHPLSVVNSVCQDTVGTRPYSPSPSQIRRHRNKSRTRTICVSCSRFRKLIEDFPSSSWNPFSDSCYLEWQEYGTSSLSDLHWSSLSV